MLKILDKVTSLLIGNKVLNECEIDSESGSYGLGYLWTVSNAKVKSTKKEVSVFHFRFKHLSCLSKPHKNAILEIIRSGVLKLQSVQNPSFLKVVLPLDETSEDFAFATEPVYGSLGVFHNFYRSSVATHKISKLERYEIVQGILTISRGLAYLHSQHHIHGGIFPNFVVVTKKNELKLATLDLSFIDTLSKHEKMECLKNSEFFPLLTGISLPPETSSNLTYTLSSDLYLLGNLICGLFHPNPSELNEESNQKSYNMLRNIQDNLRCLIERMISATPTSRTSLNELMASSIFSDSFIQLIDKTKNFHHFERPEQLAFFEKVSEAQSIPQEFAKSFIFPLVVDKVNHPDFTTLLLPLQFKMLKTNFDGILDSLQVSSFTLHFNSQNSQIIEILLDEAEFFVKRMPWTNVESLFLPFVFKHCTSPTHFDKAVKSLLMLSKSDNFSKIKDINSFLDLINCGNSKLSFCVMKIIAENIEKIEKPVVFKCVLPRIIEINVNSTSVSLAVLGLFQILTKTMLDGMEPCFIATKIIPFLLTSSFSVELDAQQFKHYILLIEKLFKFSHENHARSLNPVKQVEINKPLVTSNTPRDTQNKVTSSWTTSNAVSQPSNTFTHVTWDDYYSSSQNQPQQSLQPAFPTQTYSWKPQTHSTTVYNPQNQSTTWSQPHQPGPMYFGELNSFNSQSTVPGAPVQSFTTPHTNPYGNQGFYQSNMNNNNNNAGKSQSKSENYEFGSKFM